MPTEANRYLEAELDRIYGGQASLPKDKLKQALEECRAHCAGHNHEMKQKLTQMLESEIDKINSNTISREQAKSTLLAINSPSMDNHMESSIKEEFKKLNTPEVTANQARDLLRHVCHRMRPHHGGSPSALDDSSKHEFMKEYHSKHGTNKITADEAWETVKAFDTKQHDKMGCCEKNADWKREKDQKWDEVFDEQFKELFGDVSKAKINEQQLGELAKRMREKLMPECSRHSGKRFCQH